MRRRWRAVVVALAASSLANACAAIADLSEPSDAPADASADNAQTDATGDVVNPIDATGNGDGATDGDLDATDDGRCRLLVADSFDDDASTGRWRFLGKARLANGEVELVPNESNVAGAIWRDIPDAGTGVLHATFKSIIAPGGSPADGLAFAWSSTATPNLGVIGGNIGLCGSTASGLAVSLSSLANEVRLLNVGDGGCNTVQAFPTNVLDTKAVDVSARPANVAIKFGTSAYQTSSPRNVTVRAVGFTAATGGAWTRHAIDDVRVEICNE